MASSHQGEEFMDNQEGGQPIVDGQSDSRTADPQVRNRIARLKIILKRKYFFS